MIILAPGGFHFHFNKRVLGRQCHLPSPPATRNLIPKGGIPLPLPDRPSLSLLSLLPPAVKPLITGASTAAGAGSAASEPFLQRVQCRPC